jgi:cysteine desulfurase
MFFTWPIRGDLFSVIGFSLALFYDRSPHYTTESTVDIVYNLKKTDMKLPIYMDYHSTTPLDPQVLEAMMPYLTEKFGNAASRNHSFGWQAEAAVEKGRNQIAHLIDAQPKEIIFTSGATESDNLALVGIAEAYQENGNHIITCVTEHKAILDTCNYLEKKGFQITYLPVDHYGQVAPDDVKKALTDKTILVSLMAANNEIGTLHPLQEIGKITKAKGIMFHTDAAQAAGKIPLNVQSMNIDLMSLSGHKIYGPKGIGALYVRSKNPRVKLAPLIHGGGHERGMRSGTLNVPGIVGMGKACEIAEEKMSEESMRLRFLRDKLEQALMKNLDPVYLNGHPTQRLPNNLNLSFAFVKSEALIMEMKEIAVSSGATCASATQEPSYVLKAIGLNDELVRSSIRYGLGRFNTEEEVNYVAEKTIAVVKQLRDKSPFYEMAKIGHGS